MTLLAAAGVLVGLWIAKVIGPRAAYSRDVREQPSVVWLMCGIITFLSASVGAGLATQLVRVPWLLEQLGAGETQKNTMAMIGGGVLGIAVGAVFASLSAKAVPRAGLGLRWSDVWKGAVALVIALPVIYAASIGAMFAYERLHGTRPDAAGHAILKSLRDEPSNPWHWAAAASAIVLAPVFEELVYRGFFQSALLRATGRAGLSIVLTTAVFTLMHVVGSSSVPWYSLPAIAVLGVSMGVAFERTGRLGVAIVMHVLFNALNVTLTAMGSG
jgi:membrane protease YdiL (CAAX protease family)